MAALQAVLGPPIHQRFTQALPSLIGLDIKHPLSRRRRLCVRLAAAGALSFTCSRQQQDEEASSGIGAYRITEEVKAELYLALEGTDRGVFGITSAKKSKIEAQVEELESRNPTPNPTDHLFYKVDGCWKLIYSTVTILGYKRTKLGLRDFISLGDIYQTIDVAKERAVSVINFNAKGLKTLTGQLTIEASYKIASKTRVNIKLENSSITPDQFMNLFQKNYNLLIEIFNPEGWLDITYVDGSMRIGRDAKGNIFVLERAEHEPI